MSSAARSQAGNDLAYFPQGGRPAEGEALACMPEDALRQVSWEATYREPHGGVEVFRPPGTSTFRVPNDGRRTR